MGIIDLRRLIAAGVALLAAAIAALAVLTTLAGTAQARPSVRPLHRGHAGRAQAHPRRTHRRSRRRRRARRARRRHATAPRARRPSSTGNSSAGSSNAPFAGATCAGAEVTPAPGNLQQVASATLCLINQQRAHAGLAALRDNGKLDAVARSHSQDMTARDYFDHVSPSGSTPESRMTTAGYISPSESWIVGENIAWGSLTLATPDAIVTAWMRSPEHRSNILDTHFRDSGIGVSPTIPQAGLSQTGATYTQDFGFVG